MAWLWAVAVLASVGLIVWGAEAFAEHLGGAAVRLGVSSFGLALLLAGAEPEELATAIAGAVKHAPGIALGDVVGANVAICLVALAVGAWIAPISLAGAVRLYAWLGLPLGAICAWVAWDGRVSRPEGALLVALYIAYVAAIWIAERKPPALGEVEEIEEARERPGVRLGPELGFVLAGVIAMAGGATLLVEAVRRIAHAEAAQTKLGLTLVGFATAFELVVLAWSAARRGVLQAAVAGVVGSFAYNVTMTLGAAALIHPLQLTDASRLHEPLLAMLASLALVLLLASGGRKLGRAAAVVMLAGYGGFLALVLWR